MVCVVSTTVLLLPTEAPLLGFICLPPKEEMKPVTQEVKQESESGDVDLSLEVG